MRSRRVQHGFTLTEIAVALAILVTLAGITLPAVIRSMEQSEERATRRTLDHLGQGLLAFYGDLGRFPTTDEGLDALIRDPGATRWNGPYFVLSTPDAEVFLDARGNPIAYEVAGATVRLEPAGFPELATSATAAPVIRDWTRRARVEISTLNDAAERHRALTGNYPTETSDLVPARLGEDFASDPWGRAYLVDANRLFFYSRGPDGTRGNRDDVLPAGVD